MRDLPRKALGLFVPVLAAMTLFALSACEESPTETAELASDGARHGQPHGAPGAPSGGPYSFTNPVFDIEAAPNGNILVGETVLAGVTAPGSSTIWEIRTQGPGGTREVVEFTTPDGLAPINGLAAVGQGKFYAARGGLDLAEHAAVLHVTPSGQRVVGDIEAFEKEHDPDLFAIDDWKDPACAAASGPFTPGPQSNPYHLEASSGNTVIVGDAAGNTVLRVKMNGRVELVALFTPPKDGGGASSDSDDWIEFPFPDADDGFCYVQPVPNSVALDDYGTIYVGELTGVGALGVSRVWRIEPGTRDAVCPSSDCELLYDDFTSIIDLALGPEGDLYVVEYDEAGWLTAFGVGAPAGGTVNRCDAAGGGCQIATLGGDDMEELTFPTSITFDKWGAAWLLENNLFGPIVRKVGTP